MVSCTPKTHKHCPSQSQIDTYGDSSSVIHFYAPLIENIKGVVFFATPHKGSDLASWDRIGTRVAQAASLNYATNAKLSKDLKVNSDILKSISESFAYRGDHFRIRSFYETKFMRGLNCLVRFTSP